MAHFNHHLKKNKILIFTTIFTFLYMSCFTSCSKPKNQEKIEIAQKSARVEKGENNEVPRVETASNLITAESDNTTQSDKSEDPCAGCPAGVDAAAENPGQKKPLTQEELNQMADKLDRYFQALAEAVKEIPRDTFDPQAIVDKVGKDPESLFRWVRDNTYLVPYQGVLRGPIGVLLDRLGNSLDRALLLHSLLRLAGWEAQLVRGNLSENQAKELFREMRPIPRDPALKMEGSPSDDIRESVAGYAAEDQPDKEATRSALLKVLEKQKRTDELLKKRVSEQAAYLAKALDKHRKKSTGADEKAALLALQDHWWVQLKKGEGQVNFDPSLPESNSGKSIAEASAFFEPKSLPEELFHTVKIRVIAEQWANGTLKENVVLEQVFRPAELLGKHITFSHVPLGLSEELASLDKKIPQDELTLKIQDENEWQPFLKVGSNTTMQASFTSSGEVRAKPGKKKKPVAVDIFGALGGEETEEETDKSVFLSSEFIEYSISAPGKAEQKIRREVFDLIDPLSRAAKAPKKLDLPESKRSDFRLALLDRFEIVFQPCRISSEYYADFVSRSMLAGKEIIPPLLRRSELPQSSELAKRLQALDSLPGLEYGLALARSESRMIPGTSYFDQPNIFCSIDGIRYQQPGESQAFLTLDIVENKMAKDPKSDSDRFRVKLEQGILDTNLESLIMRDQGTDLENAADLMARDLSQNVDWIVLPSKDDAAWKNVSIPERIVHHLHKDLEEGYIIVVPPRPMTIKGDTRFGWWRIDPREGDILGMIISGAGGAQLAERTIMERVPMWIGNILCLMSAYTVSDWRLQVAAFAACAIGWKFGKRYAIWNWVRPQGRLTKIYGLWYSIFSGIGTVMGFGEKAAGQFF